MYDLIALFLSTQSRLAQAAMFSHLIGETDGAVLPTPDGDTAVYMVTIADLDFQDDVVLVEVRGEEPRLLHAHTLAVAIFDA